MGKERERDKEKKKEREGEAHKKLVCPALHQIVGKRQRQTSKNKQIWVKFYFRCRFAAVLGRQLAASRSHTCTGNETELLSSSSSSSRCGWRQSSSLCASAPQETLSRQTRLVCLHCCAIISYLQFSLFFTLFTLTHCGIWSDDSLALGDACNFLWVHFFNTLCFFCSVGYFSIALFSSV